jgi:hypothetical protein
VEQRSARKKAALSVNQKQLSGIVQGGNVAKKPVWETKDPSGKDKKLSPKKKAAAKARAKAAGRPYPNLVDNMAAARKKKK